MRYFVRDKYVEPKEFSYKIKSFTGINADAAEETLPLNCATAGYNVRFDHGVLTNAYGIGSPTIGDHTVPSALSTGEGIVKAFLYKRFDRSTGARDDRLIILTNANKVYGCELSSGTAFSYLGIMPGTRNVTFLNCEMDGQDILWISDDHGHLATYDGLHAATRENIPFLSDACVYNGRVYATSGVGQNVLKFSAEGDPTEWSEASGAGDLTFPDEGGKILRAVTFKESLIVFREHSAYRYVRYPGSSTYTLSRIFATEQTIYPKTVCVCGDKVVFLTGGGFYSYDGSGVTRIWRKLFPLIKSATYATANCFENKYFLTFALERNGETVGEEANMRCNNAFLAVETDGENYSLTRGVDVAEFIPVEKTGEAALFCYFNNYGHYFDFGRVTEAGKLFSTTLKKKWRSPKTSLSALSTKLFLREVFVRGSGPFKLIVDADRVTEYDLPAGNKTHCLHVGEGGESIGIAVETEADSFFVYGMELAFDLKKRGIYDKR